MNLDNVCDQHYLNIKHFY